MDGISRKSTVRKETSTVDFLMVSFMPDRDRCQLETARVFPFRTFLFFVLIVYRLFAYSCYTIY